MRRDPIHLRPARGFTALELLMGLVITSMVLGAVAALTTAVGQGWNATESSQRIQITARQVSARLERAFRAAPFIGAIRPAPATSANAGGASIIIWAEDANRDLVIQLSEVVLIEHDVPSRTLVRWALASDAPAVAVAATYADLSDPQAHAQFKAVTGVERSVIAHDVVEASFAVVRGGNDSDDSIEVTLRFLSGSLDRTEYMTAALRGATSRPAY